MTALARRLTAVLPTEPASPPVWRGHPTAPTRVWPILGRGRLAIALDNGDTEAAGRCIDELLADPTLGPLIRSRFLSTAGRALAEDAG